MNPDDKLTSGTGYLPTFLVSHSYLNTLLASVAVKVIVLPSITRLLCTSKGVLNVYAA